MCCAGPTRTSRPSYRPTFALLAPLTAAVAADAGTCRAGAGAVTWAVVADTAAAAAVVATTVDVEVAVEGTGLEEAGAAAVAEDTVVVEGGSEAEIPGILPPCRAKLVESVVGSDHFF